MESFLENNICFWNIIDRGCNKMAIATHKYLFKFTFLLVCLFCSLQGANAQEVISGCGGGNVPIIGSNGIWMSKEEINQLPTTGDPWDELVRRAQNNTNDPNISNQDDKTDTNTLAKALVYARTGDTTYAEEVVYTLQRVVDLHPLSRSEDWVTLGVIRSLAPYAIAADLIDLKNYAPDFDKNKFRPWLDKVRYADTDKGYSVSVAQERRPNNYGTHASASRIAAALYLGDKAAGDFGKAMANFSKLQELNKRK
jgi:hypothetical protein